MVDNRTDSSLNIRNSSTELKKCVFKFLLNAAFNSASNSSDLWVYIINEEPLF